jgi:hypothetical protein
MAAADVELKISGQEKMLLRADKEEKARATMEQGTPEVLHYFPLQC